MSENTTPRKMKQPTKGELRERIERQIESIDYWRGVAMNAEAEKNRERQRGISRSLWMLTLGFVLGAAPAAMTLAAGWLAS